MKLQITIDGKAYAVDVEVLEEDETLQTSSHAQLPAEQQASAHTQIRAGGTWDADVKVCRSPVMGLVIRVDAMPGQHVEAGEQLLVLEAMKMETHVTAPRAGTLKSVHIAQGDPVKVDQVLIEFE